MKGKKHLSSGKWLVLLLVTALLLVMIVPIFNIITDPYGAFGDPVLEWWTYDMTLNPRLAKETYLEKNHDSFDSYVIGASGSSMLSAEKLNNYLDANFYNAFFYYSDADSFRELADFLLDNYEVKNLVLNLSILSAANNPKNGREDAKNHYWKVDGTNPISFYARYLFLSPKEGMQKLEYLKQDRYLPEAYRVIDPVTGSYDKTREDADPIHSLEDYLKKPKYSMFTNYSKHHYTTPYLQQCIDAVSAVKARCDEMGVNLIVVCQPMYYKYMEYFDVEKYQVPFYDALAEITDYWDFTMSSVSYEPRFFYDASHARNPVGDMMLAKIFQDDSVYVPENFGRYVTQGSKPGAPEGTAAPEDTYSVRLPILRYGELVDGAAETEEQVSAAAFAEQMQSLYEAGYSPIDIQELRDYVEKGSDLPEKPIMITFDGGYESCYTIAFPILKQYGFRATCFAIGVSIGKDTYKDTDVAITPHFSLEQAREMTNSGFITVASQGFDIHEIEGLDTAPIRNGALQREGETEEAYVSFLTRDAQQMQELLGESANFFSYPYSESSEISLIVLIQAGTFATVCGEGQSTTVIRGLPQSLLNMPRLFVSEALSGSELIKLLEEETNN